MGALSARSGRGTDDRAAGRTDGRPGQGSARPARRRSADGGARKTADRRAYARGLPPHLLEREGP